MVKQTLRAAWLVGMACAVACAAGGSARRRPARETAVRVGDATVAVPPGWQVTRAGGLLKLEDPDRQVRVGVMRVPGDWRAAIAAAWQALAPEVALPPAGEPDSPPPTGGWDAITRVGYETPAAARRELRAEWRRLGDRGYVVLVDGDRDAAERREAQIEIIVGSLRPDGLREERLSPRPRATLDRAALDAFVEGAFAALEVPGAAIAVVVGDRVIYERTLGVRALGEPAPVTPDTRFMIGSITKPMTTLMQAALVDEGRLRWDSEVTALLPGFALADAGLTRALRLWHMSCACTGMPVQDLEGIFEWAGVTPEARLAAMREMRPTTGLGETFQYSNPMVSAGGYAAARAFAPGRPLAEAYAAAMQAKVFGPIGMTATTLDFAAVAAGNHARPHALAIDGTTRVMPLDIERAVEPIAPAGAVWSTLGDMVRYVQTELADGVAPGGRRVVSAAAVQERRKLRVRADEAGGYGLGLDVGTYRGLRTIGHDGGSFGFGATMFLLPDAKVGIVILTNVRNGSAAEHLPFNAAVKRRIVELLFPGARPLAAQQLAYYRGLRGAAARRLPPDEDRAWVDPLVGTYREPRLGSLEIRRTAAGAELDAGEWRTAVARLVGPDGSAKLVLLDPPFAGGAILVGPGPTLVVPGQTTYTFAR